MDELLRISQKAADAWRNDSAYYQAAQLIDALCDRIVNGSTFEGDEDVGCKWISVEDDCRMCANQVYKSYLRLREEMEFTREFIRKHGMEFDLMNEWNRRNT